MVKKNYISGRKFEYDVIKLFKENDLITARTAGSHGIFDVVVISKTGEPLYIQCKYGQKPTKAERKRIREFDGFINLHGIVIVAYKKPYDKYIEWFTINRFYDMVILPQKVLFDYLGI